MNSYSRRHVLFSMAGGTGLALLAACQSTTTSAPSTAPTAAPAAPPTAAAAQPAPPSAVPAQAPATVASTGSTTTITYWGAFGGHNADVQKQLVDRFNQSQKDLQVKLENQNNYEDLAAKLTTALAAKNAPEVVLLSDVWWFKFYLNNILMPLDDLMKGAGMQASDYVDVFYKESFRKNQQVWLPFARSTPIFYYNKDAWARAGLPDRGPNNWDEFITSFVPKLKGQAPVVHAVGGAASYSAWVFQGIDWQFGGAYSDPDFTIRIAEPNSVKAGNLWRDGVTNGWAVASQAPGTDFDSGTALSYMDSTAGLAGHESAAKFPVGTAFLPEGPAGFGCCTGGSGMSIVAGHPSAKQQAALKFIKFATNTDTVFWSQNTGYMPVTNAAISSPESAVFFKTHPNFKTAVDQLPKTRPQDAAREFIPNGDQIIGKGLERITTNKEDPQVVFKDVADQLNTEKQPVLRALQAMG